MQMNNTFSNYQGYEFNPEISSSNGFQNAAYAPYVYNPQTTAHNTTPGNGAYGFTTVDTASSCRLVNNNGTQSYIAATRISSFHQSLDSIGWSSNNSDCNYRTEVSATVISNGYKHSSNPSSDKSIYQSNERTEYNMHNKLPSHGSGASKKFYSNSDKPVRYPTSFSVKSVPPKECGRVRNQSIEPSRGFDSGRRSAKYFELNIKREGIATEISNGYLHSSNPKSDKSTKQINAITEYDRYKRSPSHGRETKVYSHSDKLSKTVKSPINRSQRSVSPKDHGRAKDQTIESTSGFDSKKESMATVIPNGHFHLQNPDSDKSTNKSITRTDYDRYKRLPSLGNETSKKLNSHSGKLRKSPISRSQRSVSPMVRGRKRSLSIESSKGLDSGGRSSKYVEHSNQREGSTTVISKEYLRSRNSKCDKSTNRNNIRTENDRFVRSPSYGRETPKTLYPHSDKLRKSPISRSCRSVSPKDRSRNAILKSPISRSRWPVSPENRGRKRSQSIESSRSVLRSREENSPRETRRKSIEKRNSNLGCKSTSRKQRFKQTSHEGRKSKYPMSKHIRYRRSTNTNKQRGNAHSSTSRTRSNHSKPRR